MNSRKESDPIEFRLLRDLGIVRVASEQKSFHTTARHLGIKATSIVEAINRAEKAVGVDLFERTVSRGGARLVRSTHLTLAGEQILEAAELFRMAADDAVEQSRSRAVELRLGMFTVHLEHYFADLVRKVDEASLGEVVLRPARIFAQQGRSRQDYLFPALLDGDIDFAIGGPPSTRRNIESVHLYDYKIVAIHPVDIEIPSSCGELFERAARSRHDREKLLPLPPGSYSRGRLEDSFEDLRKADRLAPRFRFEDCLSSMARAPHHEIAHGPYVLVESNALTPRATFELCRLGRGIPVMSNDAYDDSLLAATFGDRDRAPLKATAVDMADGGPLKVYIHRRVRKGGRKPFADAVWNLLAAG